MLTKLAMKEAQVVSVDDKQIISKIDNILKIAKDTTISPFGMIQVKGVIKTLNHYKCVNILIDNLPKNQCCKDGCSTDTNSETRIKHDTGSIEKFIL